MTNYNILLVDDDEASNIYSEIIIKQTGLVNKFAICKNGENALEYLLKIEGYLNDSSVFTPDLIFLDINMPIMNGMELLFEIDKHAIPVNVVMLTTSILEEDVQKALKYPFVKGFMNKPIKQEGLNDVINNLH
ncbi:response regulator [Flammeovirga kamogawensis]|uniref:Response regulator n=1 Tax=Flammeovirga kamogawensis TaxID=373891 RepID=A0ABX8GV51_9BACT|nr:response regulator [Flammeovirga kamogawensis]MBB6459643.1 CheY-like chemotaxis protein [Flammeovirga kamogawensis]QWG07294.1 response regulator [Flammeovirga kamogawensis]TRX69111.1 response regulator [Flammeovirga kamogawensis]